MTKFLVVVQAQTVNQQILDFFKLVYKTLSYGRLTDVDGLSWTIASMSHINRLSP